MQTKCPNCTVTVRSKGPSWEIIGGPCPELAGTHWLNNAEYCPTLATVARPDVVLPGATERIKVEAEIVRMRVVK